MKKSVLIVLVLCMVMLAMGCGASPASNDGKQQEQSDKEENTAVETTLGAGEWYVGEDIPPGRYVITAPKGGNISVFDKDDEAADLIEIIDSSGSIGVKSITYTLKDEQTIRIKNSDEMLFTPKED